MDEQMIELIARALCEADGRDPEYLEPGDEPYGDREDMPSPCIDGYNRKGEPCHFFWRHYDLPARAAHSVIAGKVAELTEALKQARQVLSVYQPDSAPTFYMEAIWNADVALTKARGQ